MVRNTPRDCPAADPVRYCGGALPGCWPESRPPTHDSNGITVLCVGGTDFGSPFLSKDDGYTTVVTLSFSSVLPRNSRTIA
jgi:hypothetical protein